LKSNKDLDPEKSTQNSHNTSKNKRSRSISPFSKQSQVKKSNSKERIGGEKHVKKPSQLIHKYPAYPITPTQYFKSRRASKSKNLALNNTSDQNYRMRIESIEDSIAEEQFNEVGDRQLGLYNYPTTNLSNKASSAYHSDENSSKTMIRKIENRQYQAENSPKIFVHDQDQLHVIKEWLPKKARQTNHHKRKDKKHVFSNYRKRAMEIDKQKKMIHEIEERYKEYTSKLHSHKIIDKKHHPRNKGMSLEPKRTIEKLAHKQEEKPRANKNFIVKKKSFIKPKNTNITGFGSGMSNYQRENSSGGTVEDSLMNNSETLNPEKRQKKHFKDIKLKDSSFNFKRPLKPCELITEVPSFSNTLTTKARDASGVRNLKVKSKLKDFTTDLTLQK
jgi:hypothetical protein